MPRFPSSSSPVTSSTLFEVSFFQRVSSRSYITQQVMSTRKERSADDGNAVFNMATISAARPTEDAFVGGVLSYGLSKHGALTPRASLNSQQQIEISLFDPVYPEVPISPESQSQHASSSQRTIASCSQRTISSHSTFSLEPDPILQPGLRRIEREERRADGADELAGQQSPPQPAPYSAPSRAKLPPRKVGSWASLEECGHLSAEDETTTVTQDLQQTPGSDNDKIDASLAMDLADVQRELQKMGAASHQMMLARMTEQWSGSLEGLFFEEHEMEKKRWMLTALHGLNSPPGDDSTRGRNSAPRPTMMLALFEPKGLIAEFDRLLFLR